MRMWVSFACLVFVLAAGGTAAAQEGGQVGITMGFPGSVGVIFHATSSVAIRPEFTFNRNSTEIAESRNTSWSLGTGVSALFYLHGSDHVRPYVSPRFTYTRGESSADTTAIGTSTSNGTGFSGSFGAQYTPSDRFGVFGEVGIGYTHSRTETTRTTINLTANSWGTRAGVGVIFYP